MLLMFDIIEYYGDRAKNKIIIAFGLAVLAGLLSAVMTSASFYHSALMITYYFAIFMCAMCIYDRYMDLVRARRV